MKRTKIIYWVVTGLFALFMISTAIPNIIMNDASVDLISTQLQFPKYLIPFLGWAKVIGSIAILVPGFPRIKEWAYAGLFFDLSGAMFASIYLSGIGGLAMLMFIVPHLASYFLYHKVARESNTPAVGQ
ncbi:MAG TPA: DoxX family protein [Cyclobacteriaceae bacterium]|nr:DoxX family protein [Cyclobacteriaceae bacterium]